ncbi:MAG TPA: cytochrome-c peroxidase, partial [Flavobacteriales bacterium]|nr:cytochrome-c peroxidase [Flavobacteriales bacterium]
MKHAAVCAVALPVLLLMACDRDADDTVVKEVDAPFELRLPPGAPPVPFPDGAVFTQASVALGKALFFEPRLSMGNGIACASCHDPHRAFSDSVAISPGAHGALGFRN